MVVCPWCGAVPAQVDGAAAGGLPAPVGVVQEGRGGEGGGGGVGRAPQARPGEAPRRTQHRPQLTVLLQRNES